VPIERPPHPYLLPQGEKGQFARKDKTVELTHVLLMELTETYFGQKWRRISI
jgi:hypothetical protein